jgi:hypothetical protein
VLQQFKNFKYHPVKVGDTLGHLDLAEEVNYDSFITFIQERRWKEKP